MKKLFIILSLLIATESFAQLAPRLDTFQKRVTFRGVDWLWLQGGYYAGQDSASIWMEEKILSTIFDTARAMTQRGIPVVIEGNNISTQFLAKQIPVDSVTGTYSIFAYERFLSANDGVTELLGDNIKTVVRADTHPAIVYYRGFIDSKNSGAGNKDLDAGKQKVMLRRK